MNGHLELVSDLSGTTICRHSGRSRDELGTGEETEQALKRVVADEDLLHPTRLRSFGRAAGDEVRFIGAGNRQSMLFLLGQLLGHEQQQFEIVSLDAP